MEHNIHKWDDKPYHSLNYFYKNYFGEKIYKISLNGGMSCPNRDGSIDNRGCIFCSAGGSGDFAADEFIYSDEFRRMIPDIPKQLEKGRKLVSSKNPSGHYIAYFQAYTNTYAPVNYLKKIFTDAIVTEDIVGLSIATRPDCLEDDKIELLSSLNKIKPVFVELGLQTIHASTAEYIRRGYSLQTFEDCYNRLKKAGLNVIVHVILGLPGETKADMLATCSYLAKLHVDGIKLQLLHILKNTDLENVLSSLHIMELDEYVDIIISIIERLPPDMVIHRITGDGPKKLLLAPLWSSNKKNVLNTIMKEFARRNTWQGKYYGS